jgi:hypothetical protein
MNRDRAATKVAAVAVALVAWLLCAAAAFAASPSPEPVGGDPRSSGQGPGLVGDPLFAVFAVVIIGVLSVVATLAYVRLTARRSE